VQFVKILLRDEKGLTKQNYTKYTKKHTDT